MPHTSYTHEVIRLTDGRCYCLSCDEVVAEEYFSGSDGSVVDDGTGTGAPPRPSRGD